MKNSLCKNLVLFMGGGNSFQLGSSRTQPYSMSSSNEADADNVVEIYISNDGDTPQVAAAGPAPRVDADGPTPRVDAAGPAPATNTSKKKGQQQILSHLEKRPSWREWIGRPL
ncbi:hypothetical protein Pmani_003635 [Petrolisthes manimaculis]|uniref:Uncharacterized protein n=1 Tax=Petrolisthes manimaculis TaxID=1843537 RepID=A0AAE1UJA2_9EUCA|nr:hypothetical protein Pmani_003635 [Petrolisthes manimaculis]